MMIRSFGALIISMLLLPLILSHVDAQQTTEQRVILKVTNAKTGEVTVKVWKVGPYTFGERPIDVSDNLLKKIKKIYHTDSFTFTLYSKSHVERWMHFKVELIGTPLVGKGLKIKFL